MAISHRASGSWAYASSGSVTPSLPTHAAGDMLLARVAYKSSNLASCTASTATSGWAKVGEFVGSGNSGNGTGGVNVAVFWKEAASASDTAPTIDFSQTVTQVGHVAISYQKGSTELWVEPVGAGGADTTADTSKSITVGSHVSTTSGDMVDFFYGVRDDTTCTVPTFTQTGLTLGAVSEQPATAGTNTSGADGAYDGGYRLVSSGTSSAAAVITGTLTTSETASGWTTRLRVTLDQTVALALTDQTASTFAPTITTGPVSYTPALLDQAAVAYQPTIASVYPIVLTLTDQTATSHQPTLTSLATIVPDFLDQTAVTSAPTVTTANVVILGLIDQTAVPYGPTVDAPLNIEWGPWSAVYDNPASNDLVVTPGFINQSAVAYTPTVTAVAYVLLDLIDQTAVAYSPSAASILLDLINQAAVAYSPELTSGQTISLALTDQTSAPYAPTVTSLATIALGLIDQTAAAYGPTVSTTQEIILGLTNQTAVANAPSVSAGTQFVTLGFIDQTSTLTAPIVRARRMVTLPRLETQATCLAPTVSWPQTVALGFISQVPSASEISAGNWMHVSVGLIDRTAVSHEPAAVQYDTNGGTDEFDRTTTGGWGVGPLGPWVSRSGSTDSTNGTHAVSSVSFFQESPLHGPGEVRVTYSMRWTFPPSVDFFSIPIGFEIYDDWDLYDQLIDVWFSVNGSDGRVNIYWDSGPSADSTFVTLPGEGVPYLATGSPTATLVAEINPGGLIRAKYWVDGDPDPGWQVTLDLAGELSSIAHWNTAAVWSNAGPTSGTWQIDWVSAEVLPYIDVPLISQPAATFTPLLFYNQTPAIPLLDATAAAFAPMVGSDQDVSIGLLDQSAVAHEPSFIDGEFVWLDRIERASYLYDPVIGGANQQAIWLGSIIAFAQAYVIDTVRTSATISLDRITQTATPSTPTVVRGNPTATLPLLSRQAHAFQPTIEWLNNVTKELQPSTALADMAANVLANPGYGITIAEGDFASFPVGPFAALPFERPRIIETFSGQTTSSLSNFTVTNPSSPTDGYTKLWLFVVYGSTGTATITPPVATSGYPWYQVANTNTTSGGTYIFYKFVPRPADTADQSFFTFSVSPSRAVAWTCVWTTNASVVTTGSDFSNSSSSVHSTSSPVSLDDDELLFYVDSSPSGNSSAYSSWPLESHRTAANSGMRIQLFVAKSSFPSQTLTSRSTSAHAYTLNWVKLARPNSQSGRSGWLRLHLTETQALAFDTFGSAMDDTTLSILSAESSRIPYELLDSFTPRTIGTGTTWGFGPLGEWTGSGSVFSVSSGNAFIQSGSGGRYQRVTIPGPLATSDTLQVQAFWRWDYYGPTYGSTSDDVTFYMPDANDEDSIELRVGYGSGDFYIQLASYVFATNTYTVLDTYELSLQSQVASSAMQINFDYESGRVEGYYWLTTGERSLNPQVSGSFPGFRPGIFELQVYHANAPTFASPWRFSEIVMKGDQVVPSGQVLFYNGDTEAIPSTHSSIPESAQATPMHIGPGDYYLMVQPDDPEAWTPADGDAQLRIHRAVTTTNFVFTDDADDAQTIIDPPVGSTFAVSDFRSFTQDPSDPTAILTNWDSSYSGWIKLVLTEPMYLSLDLYESGVLDTVMFVYYQDARPTSTDVPLYWNDDTQEDPFNSLDREFQQSAITSPVNLNTTFLWAAGTYWIVVWPYEGADWLNLLPGNTTYDPPETTTVTLRITRTLGIEDLPDVRPSTTTPPPYYPPAPGYSDIVITYDGVDITDDVRLSSASFTYQVNGAPGTVSIEVKDPDHTYEFVTGKELTLDIDGDRFWGGYVTQAALRYPLPVMDSENPSVVPRFWALRGVDYNILFQKRIVYDASDPADKIDFSYPVGTYDDTIINDLFDNYLDLDADGISRSGVTRVAVVTVDIPGVTTGKGTLMKGRSSVASAGYTWKQAMDIISRATGAIYYIDPYKVLHYVDVDVPNASKTLTDVPQSQSHLGYQRFRLLDNGTALVNDMLVWGAATTPIVFARTIDDDSVSEHGLWQQGLYTTGIMQQVTAGLVADSYVYGTPQSQRGGKDDAVSVQLRTFEPVLHIGEKVPTYINIHDFSDVLPIRVMTITFANPRQAVFDLTLSHAIDQPWSIYERPPLDINLPQIRIPPYPPFPPIPCIDGLVLPDGAFVLDAFSRVYTDNSGHLDVGNTQPDWGFGDRVNWIANTFQVNTHYSVNYGYGIIHAKNAHYALVYENVDKSQVTTVGSVDYHTGEFISLRTLTFIFRIQPTERVINANLISAVSENMPAWENPTNAVDTTLAWNVNEFLPDLDTGARVPAAAIIGPANIQMTFSPTEAGQITGTVVRGSVDTNGFVHEGGAWYGSDGAGFVDWTRRYANGSMWRPGQISTLSWPDPASGVHYNPGATVLAFFYTAVDERTGGDWTNKARITFTSGSSHVTIDRSEGGSGAYGITTRPESGSSWVDSSMAKIIDPGIDYMVKWYRPSHAESYVKVWIAGDAEPPDGQWASSVSNASQTPAETLNRQIQVGARVFPMQSYDFMLNAVVSGEAFPCPPDSDGPSTGEQENPADPDFDGETYHLPFAFVKNSTQVWVDGRRFRVGIDYTEQPTAGTITFTPPISATADVYVIFVANGAPV